MQHTFTCLVLSALSLSGVNAVPQRIRQVDASAKITQLDPNPAARARDVAAQRAGFEYAPSLMGDASFHLGGSLGEPRLQSDLALWMIDRNIVNASLNLDLAATSAAVNANLGLRSLDDYARVLYDGQWDRSVPGGEGPGMLTNYTQDLLFSMERLSLNPYPLRRLKSSDSLPFPLSTSLTSTITGVSSLETLKNSGRLFVVDHSYQAKYERSALFGAACTAYFYIHPISGDFLPLAIKTNTGSDLVYTPLDTKNDWLLAKLMFNVNDLFHSQFFHLAASHDVGEIVHEAALRTLSLNHPVMVILERLMYQAYAIRLYGAANLVQPGGPIDTAFATNAKGASQYIAEYYPIVGRYQAGCLKTFLRSQGLIDNNGPQFKSFPFYKDTLPINTALRTFFASFVNSYYSSEAIIAADTELQSWFVEANTAAGVHDFPACGTTSNPCTKKILIEVLTHFAFLTGVAHHSLNTGDPSTYRAVLPFHPAALYAPIPTTKNVTNILPFLPPPRAALFHIVIFASFNRAHYEATNRTLAYMFSDESVLGRLNAQTRGAADSFLGKMKELSASIRARTFGSDGLCLGMPFVWKGLDPGSVPFSLRFERWWGKEFVRTSEKYLEGGILTLFSFFCSISCFMI